ncbi:MAG: putative lipid II flippase FtsW [Patescibacteria group bacterium]|nr:putative lipid II flippase FtsW [Patescibacteria group bacterium]
MIRKPKSLRKTPKTRIPPGDPASLSPVSGKRSEQVRHTGSFSGLFIIPLLVSIVGLFFVYEASSILSLDKTGDSFHYLKLQLVWITAGFVFMIIVSFLDYHFWSRIAFFLMVLSIVLLVIVLIPAIGKVGGGARSWIDLGPFNLQPTELAKFATILYLASWLVQREVKKFSTFLILLSLLLFLIILQPDIGTAIVIFSLGVMIYFLAGKDIYKLLIFVPLGIAAFVGLITAAPYRFNRLIAFMNPQIDPQGISFHINQILISLSSGNVFGKGFGASRQKYLFLPEAHTDSVFAIIGEELGFVGAATLVIIYMMLMYLLYRLYCSTNDRFGRALAGGVFVYFGLQIIVNLGGMVALMPLTGVPLPFISYGGSHIVISFILMGIALNIARQNAREG